MPDLLVSRAEYLDASVQWCVMHRSMASVAAIQGVSKLSIKYLKTGKGRTLLDRSEGAAKRRSTHP
jgi:hypothetical protein